MEKKEYLNEEWYQQVKKKIKKVALLVLVIGIMAGICLITVGVFKQKEAKRINEERYNEAYKESEVKYTEAQARLTAIANEKETLTDQYNSKSQECDSLNTFDTDWFTKANQCRREASTIQSKINDLEMEKFKLENADYTVYYDMVLPRSYQVFYIAGTVVIILSCITSLCIYTISMKREIAAFNIQQTMPLAQEGIEKMAPTVGKAAGTVSKEIASNIKEGLKGEEE